MSAFPNTEAHPELESEQAYIDYAHECAEGMKALYDRLPNVAAHPKVAQAFRALSGRVLERLEDSGGLVFGRIDPTDEAPLYVGRHGIHDERYSTVVVNWQADAARPFYEASIVDPRGLTARRYFDTEGRRLLRIFEDVLVGEPVAAPSLRSPVEDMLLGELGRDRSDRMRDIVATIQHDQYRLVSAPLQGILAIQGAPGTGKTAIGLHRASWLLFNNRPDLERAGVLVVGPNRLFMRYIADVLPSLGEETVDQSAVQHLVARVRARHEDAPAVARLKGDPRMARVVANTVWERIRLPESPVRAGPSAVAPEVSAEVVAADIKAAQEASSTYMDARRTFTESLRRRFYDAAHTGPGPREPFADFARDLNRSGGFRSLVDRMWPSLAATQAIRELLGSRERLERGGKDLLTAAEVDLLYRRNPDREEDVQWTEHDLPLVDEAETVLNGTEESYGHVIIDEAQDLTPMQLRMVGRRAVRSSMTLLGDIAQATGPWTYRSWAEIADHVGRGAATVEELTHVYRVPQEIMELALPVLSEIAPELAAPEPFRSVGEAPLIRQVTRPFLGEEAALSAGIAAEQGGTVAVIAPENLVPEVRKALDQADIDYRDGARGELGGGVEILTPRLAKGLEFDHVVLVEPLSILREAQPEAAYRELYVAMTRPTRSLSILHAESLPVVLGGDGTFEPVTERGTEQEELPIEVASTERKPIVQAVDDQARISSRLSDALAYARIVGSRSPETARLVERALAVAGLLIEAGASEDEAIAALVAPVADASGDASEEIRRLFGPAVAEALERSRIEPDESPITFAVALQEALMAALEATSPESVTESLRELAGM